MAARPTAVRFQQTGDLCMTDKTARAALSAELTPGGTGTPEPTPEAATRPLSGAHEASETDANPAPLTDERLAAVEARAAAATAGPWGVYGYGGGSLIEIAADLEETGHGYRARRGICRLDEEPLDNDPAHREWTAEEDWAQVQADAEFIAHAPADVSALVDEVKRLRALVATVTEFRIRRPGSVDLLVRRSPAGRGFAVIEARARAMRGRRAWTADGWQFTALLADSEIFCWPDGPTAVAEAQQLVDSDDEAVQA